MATYTLWAGPLDGTDVEIPSGRLQHTANYRVGPAGSEKTLDALYLWNAATKKFEWERYTNLP